MLLVEKNKNEAGAYSTNKALISGFIRVIWNQGRLDRLENFLHEDFIDYSIPVKSLQNRTGTRLYLEKLRSMFNYPKQVTEYPGALDKGAILVSAR